MARGEWSVSKCPQPGSLRIKILCVQCLSVRQQGWNFEAKESEKSHVSNGLSPGLRRLRVGVYG